MKTEFITNSITGHFDRIISNVARYQNDYQETPDDETWCTVSVDLGQPVQKNIAIDQYRYIGNLNVRIRSGINLGLNGLLIVADSIDSVFKSVRINGIIFRIPRIVNVGRVDDNYQINIICPFFADSNYLLVECSGSLTSLSNIVSMLLVTTNLQGLVNIVSSISASLSSADEIQGDITDISSSFGVLSVLIKIQSLITETSNISGNMGFLSTPLVGITTITSNISGDLGFLLLLQSIVTETLSVSGALNIVWLQNVLIAVNSNIAGSLNITTELLANTVGSSVISGRINKSVKLSGSVIAESNILGGFAGMSSARCSVYRDTPTQTIVDNTEVKVQLNAELYDISGEFDSVTNYRFTADATGYYHVVGYVRMACPFAGAGERGQAILKVNGTAVALGLDENEIATERSFAVSKTFYLNATDYVELFIWQNSGANGTVSTLAKNTYMTVDRVN